MDVDETDLMLVHGLQIAPRAPWRDLGIELGVDPATAARRWRRLVDQRLVWTTVVPWTGDGIDLPAGAAVELRCAPPLLETVARQAAEIPWVLTVEQVTGASNLLLEVIGAGALTMARRAQEELGRLDGVDAVVVHPVVDLFDEGGSWRLDAISPHQQQRLRRLVPAATDTRPVGAATLAAITQCLREDARMPVSSVARACGWSESTARRKLDQALASGHLRLRVDLAQPATGFPVTLTAWWRVPPARIGQAGVAAAQPRSTRLSASIASGPSNLVTGSWVRDLADAQAVEAELAARMGGAELVDRCLTVRSFKRGGCLLDENGRAVGLVPIDL